MDILWLTIVDMFESEDQKKEFSYIDWLYWSDHPYATLIGIMKNGAIFTIDDEFEQDIICSSFFDTFRSSSRSGIYINFYIYNCKNFKKSFDTG